MENTPLTYKGKPLVRCGSELYYGNPNDSHVVHMQILSTKQSNGEEIADKVHVRLLVNDSRPMSARTVKEGDRIGLFTALDIGAVWLERTLSGKA